MPKHKYEGIIKHKGKMIDIDVVISPKHFDSFYDKLESVFEIIEMVDKTEQEIELDEIISRDTDRMIATMKANGYVFKP